MERAGIQKHAPGGKLDFHACRVAYINLVIESGVTVKEAQTLARHASPELTMNLYGRAREERLSETVEKVGAVVSVPLKCATYVQRLAVGAEQESATPSVARGCASLNMVEAAGVEPASDDSQDRAESQQNSANSKQFSMLAVTPHAADEQKFALPQQSASTSAHEKCVPSVHQDRDIADVVEAWSDLPDEVKARIVEIVRASR